MDQFELRRRKEAKEASEQLIEIALKLKDQKGFNEKDGPDLISKAKELIENIEDLQCF